jgi:5-methylcytosine-specific restriction endonuclease McrA
MLRAVLDWLRNAANAAADTFLGRPRKGRSGKWPALEKKAFARDGHRCRFCKKTSRDVRIVGHHIKGFKEHPELELVLANVVTLCQPLGGGCHLHEGHKDKATGKCAWNLYNPDILADCERNHP